MKKSKGHTYFYTHESHKNKTGFIYIQRINRRDETHREKFKR